MKGDHLTSNHQHLAATRRVELPDFLQHNQRIAFDAAARQRVKMRAPKGSNLLLCADVHQCWLEDIGGTLGATLVEEQRRLVLGAYIWRYLQEGIRIELPRPRSPGAFFALVERAKRYAGQGLPLPNSLMVMVLAPEDFGRTGPRLLPRDRQKKRFRAALYDAKRYVGVLQSNEDELLKMRDYFLIVDLVHDIDAYFQKLIEHTTSAVASEQVSSPSQRKPGQRRPMSSHHPHFQGSDSPFRNPYLLCYGPQRPYVLPCTADHHPVLWLHNE